jgi:hypothetical protein
MERTYTLYEWCLLNRVRPTATDFEKDDFIEDDFMLRKITIEEFKEFMKLGKYKENSTPRKPEKFLELRMYGLVPYNISEIQKGIQFNHANDVYSLEYGADPSYLTFKREWKTNIILNGGTSNEGHAVKQGFKSERYYGTMQQHLQDLEDRGIKVGKFYEPDLNSMLSAICFLVDERVFNKELYPDFVASPFPEGEHDVDAINKWSKNKDTQYANWVDKIGGPQNEFLRIFLANKRLA